MTGHQLTREDFPAIPATADGWVLHSAGGDTIRISDSPHTDWPGVLEFLAKLRNRWEFCTHDPTC